MAYTFPIIESLIESYAFATLAFLIGIIFFPYLKGKARNFLNLSNAIVLGVLVINVMVMGSITWTCHGMLSEKGLINGQESTISVSGNCLTPFFWTLILAFSYQLLFIKHRYRSNIFITIGSIFLVLIWLNLENILLWLSGLYRDYQPSSWEVSGSDSFVFRKFLLTLLYFLTCLFLSDRVKAKV